MVTSEAERRALANNLYEKIIETAYKFLHSAKHIEIKLLQMHNPTFDQIAELISELCPIITSLADDFDPMLGAKAYEYCAIMKTMANAITTNDEVELARLTELLDRKPML